MTQGVPEDKTWLEFWKQDWRIHCRAASERSREEVEAHPSRGPQEELRGKAGVFQGSWKTAMDFCVQQGLGESCGKMHLALYIQPLFRPCPPRLSPIPAPRALQGLLTREADVSGYSWILRSREGAGSFGLGRVAERKTVQEMRAKAE